VQLAGAGIVALNSLRAQSQCSARLKVAGVRNFSSDKAMKAPRAEKGGRGAGPPAGVIMHRIWVDGTEF
jgi:hypothetical protein